MAERTTTVRQTVLDTLADSLQYFETATPPPGSAAPVQPRPREAYIQQAVHIMERARNGAAKQLEIILIKNAEREAVSSVLPRELVIAKLAQRFEDMDRSTTNRAADGSLEAGPVQTKERYTEQAKAMLERVERKKGGAKPNEIELVRAAEREAIASAVPREQVIARMSERLGVQDAEAMLARVEQQKAGAKASETAIVEQARNDVLMNMEVDDGRLRIEAPKKEDNRMRELAQQANSTLPPAMSLTGSTPTGTTLAVRLNLTNPGKGKDTQHTV